MPRKNLGQENPTLTPRRSPRFISAAAMDISANEKQIEEVSENSRKSSTRSRRSNIGNLKNNCTVNLERRVTRGSLVSGCALTDNENLEVSPSKTMCRSSITHDKNKSCHLFVKMPHRNLRDQENSTPALRRSRRFTAADAVDISANKKQIEQVSRKSSRVNIERSVTCSSTPHSIVLACFSTDNSVEKRKNSIVLACFSTDKSVEKRKKRNGSRIVKHATETNNGIKKHVTSSEVAGCAEEDNAMGKKRKRTQAMKESSSNIDNGWSSEQKLALQSAYFAAKVTPNFWKKVAKKVPGKSAKECFDQIHSDFLTPPQHQPRSRAKKTMSSFSPCATKLLLSADKNANKRKPRSHLSQKKNVRQLLQKQNEVDHRGKGADFFHVLEPSVSNPNVGEFFTPELNKKESLLKRCLERSSSAHNKQLSRLSGSSTLISPPVLKPIKNKALHERYIDKLLRREAKRKAATSKTAKGNQTKSDNRDDESVKKTDVVKAAKNALMSDARDAIQQFQKSQICAMNSFCNDDDDENYTSDEDAEDAI